MEPAVADNGGPPPAGEAGPLRVMIVDDSAVVRGIFRRTLEEDPEIEVVVSLSDGAQAVDAISKHRIDVVVLDIEMPVMDGMTALPRIIAADPDVRVIMASTLTEKNAEISLAALRQGASDYIPKPSAKGEIQSADSFKRELVAKVKALAGRKLGRAEREPRTTERQAPDDRIPAGEISLRAASAVAPRIIAIGSSTGGPQALFTLFEGFRGNIAHLPVVIAQHMPKAFTGILAEHLSKVAGVACAEGVNGEALEPGRVYIAPGDYHMTVASAGAGHTIRLDRNPPENFCRPSVEPLFRSVAGAFGPAALALMLTGMGHDGLDGARTLVEGGGTVIAQDEKTSIVWGMPGAVAEAGICAAVLPLGDIAPRVLRLMGRDRP